MNYAIIIYVLGYIFNFSAGFMLLPGIVAIIYHEQEGWWFLLSALIIGIIGFLLTRKKPENKNFYAREGMVVVALGWVGISILGAVPYVATGSIPNVVNALFESVSGFSTTGASILADVESLPHCVLFWRCFTNWIGGMGLLVIFYVYRTYRFADDSAPDWKNAGI